MHRLYTQKWSLRAILVNTFCMSACKQSSAGLRCASCSLGLPGRLRPIRAGPPLAAMSSSNQLQQVKRHWLLCSAAWHGGGTSSKLLAGLAAT